MSESMTKPNLTIPMSLWGEVKVAAFRRGVKPVEIVVELLQKEFSAERVDLKRRADGLRKKLAEALPTPPEPIPDPIKASVEDKPKVDQKTCKHSYVADPERGMRCWRCGYRTA